MSKKSELKEEIEKSLDLGISWIERKQEEDGSWSYDGDVYSKFVSLLQGRLPSVKTVETTSSCARHIHHYYGEETQEVRQALDFLRKKQNPVDGAFENDWLKKKCPMATAIVGKNIAEIDKDSRMLEKALSFVEDQQQPDGHWETPGKYQMQNTFIATCACIKFLNVFGINEYFRVKGKIEKAVEYLYGKQHPDGYWILEDQEKRITQELTTLALDTLVECGYRDSDSAKKAKDYLSLNPYEETRFPHTYLKWNNTILKFDSDKADLSDSSYRSITQILRMQKPDGSFKSYHTGLGYHVVGELLDLSELLG